MDNTIHVNNTSRMLNTVKRQMNLGDSSPGFASVLSDTAASSLQAYKAAIAARIEQMPVHPTRFGDNFEISIADAGYQAMQADPSYEAFVLDTIQSALSAANHARDLTGTSTVFLRFGTEPKQMHIDSFRNGDSFMDIKEKAEKKSYWEERRERQEAQNELNDKIADARSAARRLCALKMQRGEAVTAADLSAASEIMTILLTELLAGGI